MFGSVLVMMAASARAYAVTGTARYGATRARAAVCLDKQAVMAKLNEIPVFSVANDAEQPMAEADAETGRPTITFHLDVVEAQASLAAVRVANPGAGARLILAPLGAALAMSGQQKGGVTVRLQPSLAECRQVRQNFGFSAESEGEAGEGEAERALIPLFSSDKLTFEETDGSAMTPFFFGVDDFRAAWVQSGQAADEMPPLTLTDLRSLAYEMEHDNSKDFSSTVLMPPAASMAFVRGSA